MYEISIKIVFPYCMFYNMVLMPLPTGEELENTTFLTGKHKSFCFVFVGPGKSKRPLQIRLQMKGQECFLNNLFVSVKYSGDFLRK